LAQVAGEPGADQVFLPFGLSFRFKFGKAGGLFRVGTGGDTSADVRDDGALGLDAQGGQVLLRCKFDGGFAGCGSGGGRNAADKRLVALVPLLVVRIVGGLGRSGNLQVVTWRKSGGLVAE
jgi:hypothetical protein